MSNLIAIPKNNFFEDVFQNIFLSWVLEKLIMFVIALYTYCISKWMSVYSTLVYNICANTLKIGNWDRQKRNEFYFETLGKYLCNVVVYFKLTVMLLFRFYGVIASIATPWALMNLSQYLWSTLFLATLSSAQGILLSIHSCWHNVLVFASPSLLKVNSDLRHILCRSMSYQLLADWVNRVI